MPPPDVSMEDDAYASSEDSDFALENVPDNASSGESDGDGDGAATLATRKADAGGRDAAEAEDAGFENSGDEAVIGKGRKRRRRDKGVGAGSDGEDGGAGGFVKTRSQRANEKAERRAAGVQGPVTVDVDALWKQMMGAGSSKDEPGADQHNKLSSLATMAMAAAAGGPEAGEDAAAAATNTMAERPEMITIKRTYNFAGQVHTEEKRVARDSAEAKLYFAGLGAGEVPGEGADADDNDDNDEPKHLPPRKAFRSAFEPILDPSLLQVGGGNGNGLARRTDLDLGLAARLQARERAAQQERATKLNTVEKSRMDWAGFVDREGIQDELVLAGKSKGAFVDRQQFLARTEMRREDEARRARLAGKA